MAEKLTLQQQQAVEDRDGKLLVSAAAGSGKTKVLVDRLMGYILSPTDPANIDDFLMITYTKAAAAELRGKIAAKLSERIAQDTGNRHLQQQLQRLYLAKISTVHGFCTDLLRQYAYRLDTPSDFRVAEEGECLQLQMKALEQVLSAAYETAGENPDFCAFVDSQGLGRDDRQIPEIIRKVYSSARCHLDPEKWLDWCAATREHTASDAAQTPWGKYLLEDLRQYLRMQIDAMERCIAAAALSEGMEKPTALFAQTVAQLRVLCDAQTWDAVVQGKQIDFGRLTFPKNITDLQLAEQMKAVRDACKDGLAKRLRSFCDPSAQVLEDLAQTERAARGLVQLVRDFTKAYDRLKSSRGVLDFGDLEHKTLDLLLGRNRSGATAVAAEVGARFREVLVDEYQDSNGIQDAIFNALTQKRQNCFMVGDVKQSIYQFRLADPGIFVEKYNAYAPVGSALTGQGRKVLLSHNFRSSGGVISAVNDVFSQCMSPQVGGLAYGDAEMLREGIPHIPLHEPEVSLYGVQVDSDTYAEEAAFVAEQIITLLDGSHSVRDGEQLRPIRPEDIVILLRSPGSVGGEFQHALRSRGIRCTTGESGNLLQSEEIATVRAILQIIHNPLQDIPLAAALTSPVFGYTAEDLAVLRSKDRQGSLYTLLCKATDAKSKAFLETLSTLRSIARLSTVTQLVGAVYTETDLLSTYGAVSDGECRLANLQSFFQLVSDYETAGPKELSRLLEFLDMADERGLPGTTRQDKGAVTIMSIHKSKGLEFPVVFLCGLSRAFNQESARNQVLCDQDLGLGLICMDRKLRVGYPTVAKRAISTKLIRQSVSEELRVLYVAMTRARDMLVMTYAAKNLTKTLQELAMRLDMTGTQALASEADCPGAWVLQAALTRTEAGAFFALGGKPNCTSVRENPWNIQVVTTCTDQTLANCGDEEQTAELSEEIRNRLYSGLHFAYRQEAATVIPSKLTATQLKGRVLDTEIAEGSGTVKPPEFRKPGLSTAKTGKQYGNAIHAVMQYIRYDRCGSLTEISEEIKRLVSEQLISPEQAEVVDGGKLLTFFTTPLGSKLRTGRQVLREFKFSVLDDAEKYYPAAGGEQILLQGVVDCALIEDDGITVLDFKTDRVTEQTISSVAAGYRSQVQAYAQALSRIYQMPIKSAQLYFFGLDRFVEVL